MVWVVHINRVISWVDKWLFRVSCRMTVKHRLEALKMSVTNAMRPLQFVATTTDCWSARGRSYIGVTAHWIDVDSLERRSVALACKRLKGSHTFDVLASALEDIHAEYAIREKVVKTTMDNGSNFMKAFSVFAACRMMMTMLSHQRCACHSLNLVCTTDAQHAEDKPTDQTRPGGIQYSCRWNVWCESSKRRGKMHCIPFAMTSICQSQYRVHKHYKKGDICDTNTVRIVITICGMFNDFYALQLNVHMSDEVCTCMCLCVCI